MLFMNPIFNYTGGPGWNAGYVLFAGGLATTGVSALVDRYALDGSGSRATSVLTNGSRSAGGFGTNVVGWYVGGAYNNSSSTSTTMNSSRSQIYNVMYGSDTWSTNTMASGNPNSGASFGNSTQGYVWGGINATSYDPTPGQGLKYVFTASTTAPMSTLIRININTGCSNSTDGISLAGNTYYWSSSYTPVFATSMYGYNFAGDTYTTPTTIIPSARAGMQSISNASYALFNNGATGSSVFTVSYLYTWSSKTAATLTATMSGKSMGGAACGTARGIFAGGFSAGISGSNAAQGGGTATVASYLWASQTYATGTALGTARNGITGLSSKPGYQGG